MRQPETRQLGAAGVSKVKTFFELLGWGPNETGEHDLGTDLFVQMRGEGLTDLGWLLGVQVKTGSSFFRERTEVAGIAGWWFRDTNEHAGYWLSHHVVHIIVLVDEHCEEAFWAALSITTIERTKSGIRVFIPQANRLEADMYRRWYSLALERHGELALRGAAWNFRLEDIEKRDWAIYAMLASQLVAPHPNRRVTGLLWPHALALCIQAEPFRWVMLAKGDPRSLSPDQARDDDDVGWRLAARVHDWVSGRPDLDLNRLQGSSDDMGVMAADAVVRALVLFERGDPEGARAVIHQEVSQEHGPRGRAWLRVIAGRIAQEQGDLPGAKSAWNLSESELSSVLTAEVPVDVLRSSAVVAQFNLEPFAGDRGIGEVLVTSDNAPSWWRYGQTASALTQMTKRQFEDWAQTGAIRIADSRSVNNELFSGALAAQLAGSWEEWRSRLGLLARANLISGETSPIDAFRDLRSSGDHRALSAAVRRLRADGPLRPVNDFVSELSLDQVARSTISCDLALISVAGHYCTDEHARVLLDRLLDELLTPTWPTPVSRMSHIEQVVAAVRSLHRAARPDQLVRICRWLFDLPEESHKHIQKAVASLASDISVPDEVKREWAERISTAPQDSQRALVLALLGKGEDAAQQIALSLLEAGDFGGLRVLDSWDTLTPEAASGLRAALSAGLDGTRPRMDGSQTFKGRDDALTLASYVLACRSDDAAWEILLNFLADSTIRPEFKRSAVIRLLQVHHNHPLTRERAFALHTAIQAAREGMPPGPREEWMKGLGDPIGGVLDAAWLESHPKRGVIASDFMARWLSDPEKRSDLLPFMARHTGWEHVLLAMIGDGDKDVKSAAAGALAQRLASLDHAPAGWVEAIISAVEGGGETVARAVIRGVCSVAECAPRGGASTLLEALLSHSDPFVREGAQRLVANAVGQVGGA